MALKIILSAIYWKWVVVASASVQKFRSKSINVFVKNMNLSHIASVPNHLFNSCDFSTNHLTFFFSPK